MASYLTSDTLIESIKRRGGVPTSQSLFEDSDFLAFANEEMDIGLVPSVLQYHEEYFVYEAEAPLTASTSRYAIPERAIGTKIRTVHYQDSNDNLFEMTRISPDDVAFYQHSSGNHYSHYYIQNNHIVLTPDVGVSPSGSLRITYFLRPNRLVGVDEVGIITAITDTTITIDAVVTAVKELTLSSMPSAFATTAPCDLLEAKGGHRTKAMDLSPLSVDSTAKKVYFDPDEVPTDLVVGDHVALAGECVIPQLPDDLHSVLAQRVIARCVESMGDIKGLEAANAKLGEMEAKTAGLIDNRSEGNPLKVVNLRGAFRQGRNGRRRI